MLWKWKSNRRELGINAKFWISPGQGELQQGVHKAGMRILRTYQKNLPVVVLLVPVAACKLIEVLARIYLAKQHFDFRMQTVKPNQPSHLQCASCI
jgi:hypothetical protein